MDDETLWDAFHGLTLPSERWHHEGHVRVAFLHLQRFELDEAHLRMRAAIIRLNAAHGLAESPRRGYHESLTRLWLCLVAAARATGAYADSTAFCMAHPELFDPAIVAQFYTRERLFSAVARSVFVPPDLAPLPGPLVASHARRGHVHHIDLSVSDPRASRVFYQAFLGFLGYRVTREDVRGFDFELQAPDGGFCSIGLMQATGPGASRAHDRYSPGLHHLAWHASSREDVLRLHEILLERGATILDAPAEYPHYGNGYYALFFSDPDGLKLEVVHGGCPPQAVPG